MATRPVCKLPKPLSNQVPILLNDRRFKLLACGRRFGKTAIGLLSCLRGHGPQPGHFRGAIDGGTIWWVAPSYPTIVASNIWSDLKRATEFCTKAKSEVDRKIELTSGGSITVRSADNPDSLRGPGLDGLFVDEAAFLSVEAWRKSLRPALSDKHGWAMLASTPNGRNWFFDQYRNAVDSSDWAAWRLPSWANPLITAEEMESVKREIGPRAFAQEHAAEFAEIAGALWPGEYFDDRIWASQWPGSFDYGVVAIDPSIGKTDKSDYSAIVFVGLRDGLFYCDCSIERRPPTQIVADTVRMFDEYRPAGIGVEINGFQEVLMPLFDFHCQQINRPPLPLYTIPNTTNKVVRIQRLDPYLAGTKIQLRPDSADCAMMVEQLLMFPNKGFHDDGPDALEMAIRLANEIFS